jgi:uncharacterized repeat protein (TIGR01451 family)
LPAVLAGLIGFVLSNSSTLTRVQAFSAGPPAGYTGAPAEEPEACAECHVPPDAGTGHISINAPQTYVPGQTYQITVTHANADTSRQRWGFELTALDTSDEKVGNLQSIDGTTQVLNNAGPGSARQYIEHTSAGTFIGQQGGASWTFNWTAPATDAGPVTFYTAGNQANNDGNTSGDYIYKTFVVSAPASTTPDFALTVSPASRNVVPGGSAQYTLTVTPLAGFTGLVTLGATNLPGGVTASFNPVSVNLNDATSKSSTVTLTSTVATPIGDHSINLTGQSGSLNNATPVGLKVVNPASVDLAVAKTASPNPGQVGLSLTYRIVATNNGPATATNVSVVDNLPAGVTFSSSNTSQGSCSGTSTVTCQLGTLASGSSAVIAIVVNPNSQGSIINNATIAGTETDFDPSNNTATNTISIQPAAATPSMLDANLTVSTVVSGLNQPTTMAFIGPNEFFVLERTTGRVQRVLNGVLQTPALDLAVNNASERGLLGIALHQKFTENGFVFLYWTESSTGIDTSNTDEVPLLGNRVDRYKWNGNALVFDRNIIRLRALQADAGQTARGNHNGGVLRTGPDGKLYLIIGDNGRRGFLQNVTSGGPVPDDQFGGPEPDNAHLTGVILRLNDDGSTPADNPFVNSPTTLTGEAALNIKKVFAYGVRNGFGMAFDPLSGQLWNQENGDDAFDEINRVIPGFNGGWIQAMGPINRIDQFKAIESTYGAGTLQQLRWPPSNIATTPQQALARLYMIPGAQYVDPEFSWKYALAPSPIGFLQGRGLGPEFEGDLFVGASRTTLLNGFLFRFQLTADRQHFSFSDPLLADRVADNLDKFDQTESESLVIGRDFGITSDIQTGPNGNLFVVSLSNGAVYEVKSKPILLFVASLNGAQETPANNSTATGSATLLLSPDEKTARVSLNFSGLSSTQTAAHIHGPAVPGVSGPVIFPLPNGAVDDFEIQLLPSQVVDLKNGLWYVNVHSNNFMNGEIRGQLLSPASASSLQFAATKYVVNEGEGDFSLTVTRIGSSSSPATVNFGTSDSAGPNNCNATNGHASSRCDYIGKVGELTFAAGEASKTIVIPIVDDVYAEGPETFQITLSNPSGASLGSPATATLTINDNETTNGVNPIDTPSFFVRQHYIDFLNREPDAGGFNFWTNEFTVCGADPQCLQVKRVNVSAAFFLSTEFQETGYLVYRMYKSGFGNLPGAPVPVTFNNFLRDTQQIGKGVQVGAVNFEIVLENNKQAYALEFVQRPEFVAAFLNKSATQFVAQLNTNAGNVLSAAEQTNLVNILGATPADATKRAQVLRAVAEDQTLRDAEFNKAFVLMQYFGYLRRGPNQAPDTDFSGYNFWLTKLNSFGGNFVNAEMVKAFIISTEYRQRFGP